MTGSNLTKANLVFANLTGANLTGANLTGANLVGVNLTEANLDSASLTGANLEGSNLTRANLTRANLENARLTDSNWKDTIVVGTMLGHGSGLSSETGRHLIQKGAISRHDFTSSRMSQPITSRAARSNRSGTISGSGEIKMSPPPSAPARAEPFSGLIKKISKILPLNYSATDQKSLDEFDISVLRPARLAKGFSAGIGITIYLPEVRSEVELQIHKRQEQEKEKVLTESTYSSGLVSGKTVRVELYSSALIFSKAVVKTLDLKLNEIAFTVIPSENCTPGRQFALLSIEDANTEEEYVSISFDLIVDDYAFDHVSKPFLSFVSSASAGVGSIALFVLTYLQQIDTTLGVPAGTAAAAAAAFWGIRPKILYNQNQAINQRR